MGREHKVLSIYGTYESYAKELGKEALPKATYTKVMFEVFKRIARWLIIEGPRDAFWKIPNGGGYLKVQEVPCAFESRQAKNYELSFSELTGGKCFYLKWHNRNKYTKLKLRKLWRFRNTRGDKNEVTGIRGLNKHVVDCARDPFKELYTILNRSWT